MNYSKDIVLNDRFEQLKSEITDYESVKAKIMTGVEDYERIRYQKKYYST